MTESAYAQSLARLLDQMRPLAAILRTLQKNRLLDGDEHLLLSVGNTVNILHKVETSHSAPAAGRARWREVGEAFLVGIAAPAAELDLASFREWLGSNAQEIEHLQQRMDAL